MARVRVDSKVCAGHGRCYALAPDVFEADEAGYCAIVRERVEGALLERARTAAAACPERAIEIDP